MQQSNTYQHTKSLQISDYLETFAQQVKRVLHPVQKAVRTQFALLHEHYEQYHSWKVWTRAAFSNPEDEFCLQTVFVHFLRTFFLSICEDYGINAQDASNGFAEGGEYTGSHGFFDHLRFYDWYAFDEKTISALLHVLDAYDFRALNVDVLGRIYSEGYIGNKARSEKGQFYTPPHIVEYMLDAVGMPDVNELDEVKARTFLEKTVGDLSCGSGSFLVAAAARKRAILQRLIATRQSTPNYALHIMTSTFLGFDLNPFACYLAEINLLMQCLPFLLNEQEQLCRWVDHFHIYCADVLEPTAAEQSRIQSNGKVQRHIGYRSTQPAQQELSEEEQRIAKIKNAKGLPTELTLFPADHSGIDYLLGNPPYVSASESPENLSYRDKVWSYGIYSLLHQRWDLFVPFFERNLQFLRPGTGRLGLIISNGIETEGYAERLRQLLSSQYCLLQLDFFPGVRLFQDAAVENTIVFVENHPPDVLHEVIRRKHLQADCQHFETLPPILQLPSNGQIFRWRYDPVLDKNVTEGSIPLCAIVYIGTGVEAQSDEDFDPIVEGKRRKRFTLNDVFLPPSDSAIRPPEYTDEGVLGDDVDRYYLRRKRYVAYEKYRPQMRGPRHIALFHTHEKLLLGETSGGYYDRTGLFANHSVQVVVSWKALEQAGALEEKGIQTVLRKSRQLAGSTNDFASIAELFDLRYLLGIINSRFMRRYIASNMHEGTREGRIYPDIWKRLPIKVVSAERQQQIALLVDAVQAQYQRLAVLPTPNSLASNPTIHYRDIQGYLAQGVLRFSGDAQCAIAENKRIHADIDALLLQIEDLVELTYREPADVKMMEIINSKKSHGSNGELF